MKVVEHAWSVYGHAGTFIAVGKPVTSRHRALLTAADFCKLPHAASLSRCLQMLLRAISRWPRSLRISMDAAAFDGLVRRMSSLQVAH